MANSARDPFWQAKVDHEGLVNPTHRESIENLCTACHAPQGYHEAHMTGKVGPNGYTMEDLLDDELGLDGVGAPVATASTMWVWPADTTAICPSTKRTSLGAVLRIHGTA